MTQIHCIKKMLGIEDPNIQLEENPVGFKNIKQVNHIIIEGKLTYILMSLFGGLLLISTLYLFIN